MKFWLWILVIVIVIEVAAFSSKETVKEGKQHKNKEMDRSRDKKLRRRMGKQSRGIFSSKGKIGRLWIKIKRPLISLYNKAFWTMARFFNGKRSYTWKVFGKRIRIVMPRMPRSWKETKKRVSAFRKAIRRDPMGRCLVAIYANLAIFVVGYTVLFIYNIYCYFCYRRAKAAAHNGKPIFKPDHVIVGSNLPKNLSSAIKKAAVSAAKRARPEQASPTSTVLEEEKENIRGADDDDILMKPSPNADSKNTRVDNELSEYVKRTASAVEAKVDVPEELPSVAEKTPRVSQTVTLSAALPATISGQQKEGVNVKKRLFAASEISDRSEGSSNTSTLRRRIQRRDDEAEHLLSRVDNEDEITSRSFKTPSKFRSIDGDPRFSGSSSNSEGNQSVDHDSSADSAEYVSKALSVGSKEDHIIGPNSVDENGMMVADVVLENNQEADATLTENVPKLV